MERSFPGRIPSVLAEEQPEDGVEARAERAPGSLEGRARPGPDKGGDIETDQPGEHQEYLFMASAMEARTASAP